MIPKWIEHVVLALAVVTVSACQFKEPFVGTVNVKNVDGKRVKAGVFKKSVPLSQALAPDAGFPSHVDAGLGSAAEDQVILDVEYQREGRVVLSAWNWGSGANLLDTVSLAPAQLATHNLGPVVFTPPPNAPSGEYALVAWYDENNNGRLDLSSTGTSEVARTVSKEGAYLTFYNYSKESDSYTATAVTPEVSNRIISKGDTRGWSVTITADVEGPSLATTP